MNSKHLLVNALALAALAGEAKGAETARGVQPNAVSCRLIRTAAQLQAMRNDVTANYCLANDIDLASIANFVPVGDINTPFTGSFFGNKHLIRNLTISDKTHQFVGLFGWFQGTTVRDVTLVNVNVKATALDAEIGGLAGISFAPTMTNLGVSGRVTCGPDTTSCGGIIGALSGSANLAKSWSSADVAGSFFAGGLIGFNVPTATVSDSFATGNVGCTSCTAGGLAAETQGPIVRSFATGVVDGSGDSVVGGLVGIAAGPISQSFASGRASAGGSSTVGGLVGEISGPGASVDQSFSVGFVFGDSSSAVGGLIGGVVNGAPLVTNSYWDIDTSTSSTSVAASTGMTTAELRAALPPGFDPQAWAINKTLSYPFLNDPDLGFTAQLATLVPTNAIFTFLPISQLDVSQYRLKPAHADQAGLATVYTMLARATGLDGLKIDRFFWHDATQTTTFAGPITDHVRLGAFKSIAAAANLKAVIDVLNTNRLVILRGTYTDAKGATATHWMLATLYTRNGRTIGTIVANDPWTGRQVEIDPVSKTVLSPDFPLANFKVNGFQPAAVLLPN